jgi:hypothetical protein
VKRGYLCFRRLVFEGVDLGGFLRFLGGGFEGDEVEDGNASADGDASTPAAARNSPRRASSSKSAMLSIPEEMLEQES